MSEKDKSTDASTNATNEEGNTPKTKKAWRKFRQAANIVGDISSQALKRGGESGRSAASVVGQTVQDTSGRVQRKLGEDYYGVIETNPLILDTMSRKDMLVDNRELLQTVFNIPWSTTIFWSAAAGSILALQHPIGKASGQLLHYGPGHIKAWNEVSQFMDSVPGVGHRLKFGHSIEYLPQIIEKFGIEGVPAFFGHLAQDFATVDGIPIIPDAWDVKKWLEIKGLSPKAATGLVSINFNSMLGALALIALVHQLWQFGDAVIKKVRVRKHLKIASDAVQNRDYNAAVANYKRALEIKRSPAILMALGQTYMHNSSKRLVAHQTFLEAMTLLSDNPSSTIPYGKAELSLRGLAGIQALATSDVLAGIHPEHWNDHVDELVNGAVYSFASVAKNQAYQNEDIIPDMLVAPAHFSAAINYYLAAKTACYYPLAEHRYDVVIQNLKSALQQLGLVAQYNEEKLRLPTDNIKRLWAMELVSPNDFEKEIDTYIH